MNAHVGELRVVIVDLDGTIADNNHRGPFEYEKAGGDAPIRPVIRVVQALALVYRIIYMTGREEWSRGVVREWLNAHDLPEGSLYMRPDGDNLPDSVVKSRLFTETGVAPEDVEVVIDDRLSVIEMWRGMGFTVFDVAGNTF